MHLSQSANSAKPWYTTYAVVILLVGVLVNLTTSFLQYAPNLTLPAMQDSLSLSYTQTGLLVTGAWMLRVPCSFLAGILTTRYSSRRLIGLSTLMAGVSMLLLVERSISDGPGRDCPHGRCNRMASFRRWYAWTLV